MHRNVGALARLAASIVIAATAASAQAMAFLPGDTYTSDYSSRTINHYDASGKFVDSLVVPSSYGSEVRGLAFGQDHLLYAVTSSGSNFHVIALDQAGHVQHTYSGPGYVGGNISSGKITFGADGRFYVAAANNLVEFKTGTPTGKVIHTDNQVFDSALLPSGHVLELSAYGIDELTADGAFVRAINSSTWLVDARGIAYDAATNDIYVSMLGYSGEFFRLMRLDGTTGKVEKDVNFWYADDLYLTKDDRLLVGSRTLAPEFFDLDLNPLGALGTKQQMFVTQTAVPEPSALALFALGMLAVLGLARRRPTATSAR